MGQLVALLESEQLDGAARLAAIEAINELAVAVETPDDQEATDLQVDRASRLRALAPGGWEFFKLVLQSVLTAAARQRLGL